VGTVWTLADVTEAPSACGSAACADTVSPLNAEPAASDSAAPTGGSRSGASMRSDAWSRVLVTAVSDRHGKRPQGGLFHDADGVFHHSGTTARVVGPDPERNSYASFASFSDPDGNGWMLQEVTTRLPGR
jgi:hypothetical protein